MKPSTKIAYGARRRGIFKLPSLKGQHAGSHAQISGAGYSAASTQRVLENTPNLKAIYEFLEKDKA